MAENSSRAAVLRPVAGGVDLVRSFIFRQFELVRSLKLGGWGGEFGSFLKIASRWHLREERYRAKYMKEKYTLGPLKKKRFWERFPLRNGGFPVSGDGSGGCRKWVCFVIGPDFSRTPAFRTLIGAAAPDAGLCVAGSGLVVVIWSVILDVFCNGAVQKAVLAGVGKSG